MHTAPSTARRSRASVPPPRTGNPPNRKPLPSEERRKPGMANRPAYLPAGKSDRYSPYPSASSRETGMKRSDAELMQ